MSTRTILSVLAFALLMANGCGGGGDEGRATLRGVVVDGNPYTRNDQLGGHCVGGAVGCSYKTPLPPPIADVEVRIIRSDGNGYYSGTEVARVRTDASGAFSASLPPGDYQTYSSLDEAKREAGYCVSEGSAKLENGDDKSVVIGSDLCRNFTFIID